MCTNYDENMTALNFPHEETNLKTGLHFHLKEISVTRVDFRATAVPRWDIVKLWNDLKQLSRRGWRCFDQRHRRDQKYLLCPSQT